MHLFLLNAAKSQLRNSSFVGYLKWSKIESHGFNYIKKFLSRIFPLENLYSVVPSKWLIINEGELLCSWPSKNTANASDLVKSAESVPSKKWKKHKIDFVKSYGNFVIKLNHSAPKPKSH